MASVCCCRNTCDVGDLLTFFQPVVSETATCLLVCTDTKLSLKHHSSLKLHNFIIAPLPRPCEPAMRVGVDQPVSSQCKQCAVGVCHVADGGHLWGFP